MTRLLQFKTVVLATVAFLLGGLAVWAVDKPDPPQQESLDVRYAQAHLDLAVANLARVDRANQRVSNAVAGVVVAAYQQDLEIAKVRLQAAREETKEPFEVWLRIAEGISKGAERHWRSAAAANQRAAGTVHELDIERLRLRSEVAKINLERGQALAAADVSPQARLEWQNQVLYDELQRLDEEVLRNAPGSRLYPVWRY